MKQKVFDYIEELERKAKESDKYFKLWHEEKIKNNKAIEYIEVSIEEGNYFEDDIATDISEQTYDKYVNSNSLLDILKKGEGDCVCLYIERKIEDGTDDSEN